MTSIAPGVGESAPAVIVAEYEFAAVGLVTAVPVSTAQYEVVADNAVTPANVIVDAAPEAVGVPGR
jgi:hypothetical protein